MVENAPFKINTEESSAKAEYKKQFQISSGSSSTDSLDDSMMEDLGINDMEKPKDEMVLIVDD